jgi:D-ornithine 4,5-aminomutase subunit alpha
MVDPLLDLGKEYTSKSIERSILLRMGFSSLEAKKIVDILNEYNMLRKGAGHCVYRVSRDKEMNIREAGNQIGEGKHLDYLMEVFDKDE